MVRLPHYLTQWRGGMSTTVSMLVEIPEALHEILKYYLDTHPHWDQDRIITAALSLFLLQNGGCESSSGKVQHQQTVRVYLDALFKHPV